MNFHGSMLDILTSRTRVKIIRFLLTHEASMSEREIASILKVSHMSVNRTMRVLEEAHFCSYVSVGKSHVWKVNRSSYAYKALSVLITGVTAIKTPMNDLKATLSKQLSADMIQKAVLFGSVSKGAERPGSDIDIFLMVKSSRDKERLAPLIEKLSDACFEAYGNRLIPYILTEQEMRQKKDLKILSDIETGIRII